MAIEQTDRSQGESQDNNPDKRQWLSWICESSNSAELEKKYNTWARTYETDVREDWALMPDRIAQMLDSILPDKSAKILDAGAGTGWVGAA